MTEGGPPAAATRTSTQLLKQLASAGNQRAWEEFVTRYRPMLVRYGRRVGLSAADADDFAQNTLMAFAESYRNGRYDRSRGRLRDWMWGIARRQLAALRRGERRAARQRERAPVAASPEGLHASFDDEWRRAVISACLEQVRLTVEERTFRAFELFALQGAPAAVVAEQLELTENAVFQAKRRVLRKLREALPAMDESW